MDCSGQAQCFLLLSGMPQVRRSVHISVSVVCPPGIPESECIHIYAWNILFGILPNEIMVMYLRAEQCALSTADV